MMLVHPIPLAADAIFEESREIPNVVHRAYSMTEAIAANPQELLLVMGKCESVNEQLQDRLDRLCQSVASLIESLPEECKYLATGEEAGKAMEILEECQLEVHPKEQVRILLEEKQRTMGKGKDTAEAATMTSRKELVEPYLRTASVQTIEFSCTKMIQNVTKSMWRRFVWLQYQRIMWLFRLRSAMRKDMPNPMGHARRVMQCYSSLRQVYEKQLSVLHDISDAADDFREYELSYSSYKAFMARRISHVSELMGQAFYMAFDFVQHIVRNLQPAKIEIPQLGFLGPKGNALRRKEESVRRLRKRKPWLFLKDLEPPTDEPLVNSAGCSSGNSPPPAEQRFNEPLIFPAFTVSLHHSPHHPSNRTVSPSGGFNNTASTSNVASVRCSAPDLLNQFEGEQQLSVEHTTLPPVPPAHPNTSHQSPDRHGFTSSSTPRGRGKRFDTVAANTSPGQQTFVRQLSPQHKQRHGMCSKCKLAKSQKQPPPRCTTTGCVVAKTHTLVERSVALGIGPTAQ